MPLYLLGIAYESKLAETALPIGLDDFKSIFRRGSVYAFWDVASGDSSRLHQIESSDHSISSGIAINLLVDSQLHSGLACFLQ